MQNWQQKHTLNIAKGEAGYAWYKIYEVSLFKVKNKGKSPTVLLSENQFWEYAFP